MSHVGKTVHAAGESRPMKIIEDRGPNKHGTPMFRVELASKATRLYSGYRLWTRTGNRTTPLISPPGEAKSAA